MSDITKNCLPACKPKKHKLFCDTNGKCKPNKKCLKVIKKGDQIPKLQHDDCCENKCKPKKSCKPCKPSLHVVQHCNNNSCHKPNKCNNNSSSSSCSNSSDSSSCHSNCSSGSSSSSHCNNHHNNHNSNDSSSSSCDCNECRH